MALAELTPPLRDLLESGEVSERDLYHAAIALARLHDRGVGGALTLRDMCEVLGYLPPRRPAASSQEAASGLG